MYIVHLTVNYHSIALHWIDAFIPAARTHFTLQVITSTDLNFISRRENDNELFRVQYISKLYTNYDKQFVKRNRLSKKKSFFPRPFPKKKILYFLVFFCSMVKF